MPTRLTKLYLPNTLTDCLSIKLESDKKACVGTRYMPFNMSILVRRFKIKCVQWCTLHYHVLLPQLEYVVAEMCDEAAVLGEYVSE